MREMIVELVWLLSTHDIIIAWLNLKVTLKNGMYEVSGHSNYIIVFALVHHLATKFLYL